MPPAAGVLIAAILITGFAAARVAAPQLWLVTPIVVAVVLRGAVKRVTTVDRADLDAEDLPPALRRSVNAASSELSAGEARELLAAVVRRARPMFVAEDERFTHEAAAALRSNVAELVAACCTTALDLARLDGFLAPAGPLPQEPSAGAQLDARARAARVLFARRLADAELALRSLYTAGVERGTPASDRVNELVMEIQSDAAARRAASDELRQVLGVNA